MPRAMPAELKAMRAQYRREEHQFFNEQLDTAIKHNATVKKQAIKADRKVAMHGMHHFYLSSVMC